LIDVNEDQVEKLILRDGISVRRARKDEQTNEELQAALEEEERGDREVSEALEELVLRKMMNLAGL